MYEFRYRCPWCGNEVEVEAPVDLGTIQPPEPYCVGVDIPHVMQSMVATEVRDAREAS